MTQTVGVSAQTPLLQSETSSLGQVVEARKVTEAPLNGRNPLALVAVVPRGGSAGLEARLVNVQPDWHQHLCLGKFSDRRRSS